MSEYYISLSVSSVHTPPHSAMHHLRLRASHLLVRGRSSPDRVYTILTGYVLASLQLLSWSLSLCSPVRRCHVEGSSVCCYICGRCWLVGTTTLSNERTSESSFVILRVSVRDSRFIYPPSKRSKLSRSGRLPLIVMLD